MLLSESLDRLSLQGVIRETTGGEDVELLDLAVRGDSVTLLRTKKMPEYAFLMWKFSGARSTLTQIAFKTPGSDSFERRFAAVCLCCGGTGELAPLLNVACERYGITTIFARKADRSRDMGDDVAKSIRFVEAWKHREAYEELYGREVVEQNLQFIDYANSDGMTWSPAV